MLANNPGFLVFTCSIIALSELSEEKVRNHLNKLERLHLAKEALPKASRAEFRLWNITGKGLQELSDQDPGSEADF